ncbi:hypothetical protein B0H19DRAFT_302681 [Mycena capillaripes]|nr:hypothetical protein B0H19DRAFT_302681 [Mycena capillaripes]
MSSNDARSARLKRTFNTIRNGKAFADKPMTAKLYLEAIPTLPDAALTVELLVTSADGLKALQTAMRSNLTLGAILNLSVPVITYIQHPSVKAVGHGTFLTRIVQAIVGGPAFWDAFTTFFNEGRLDEAGQCAFAWILLELIHIPDDSVYHFLSLATEAAPRLKHSIYFPVRQYGTQIAEAIAIFSKPAVLDRSTSVPGGRHDNDHADFRKIAILPTADEIACTELPFLRFADALDEDETPANRDGVYLDHLYRLLREDMLYELREEVQHITGRQKGRKHRGFVVDGLSLIGYELGQDKRREKWAVVMKCSSDIPALVPHETEAERFQYLRDSPKFLRHQSLTCLFADSKIIAFPSLRRDERRLAQPLPELVLELTGESAMQNLLLHMKTAETVRLVQIDVALFAYEPVLDGLKRIRTLPLSEELLFWRKNLSIGLADLSSKLQPLVDGLRQSSGRDIGEDIRLDKKIALDPAQTHALISGLTQKISIIQGPPGTGKSFIGAIIAKYLYLFTNLKILVVCYTNHALDQFLEDLLDIGIDQDAMVRIGAKGTTRTEPMLLRNQHCDFKFGRGDWTLIDGLKLDIADRETQLNTGFQRYLNSSTSDSDLMAFLEFHKDNVFREFFEALVVPTPKDGMSFVDRKGRAIGEHYLLKRWRKGWNAGQFSTAANVVSESGSRIWAMPNDARFKNLSVWAEALCREAVEKLCQAAKEYNKLVEQLQRKFKEKDGHILQRKRVIGCTTTAAAKYTQTIQEAAPDVILVEEAGEILECHVITALGESAKQLILIGDHKQLRPKVNNYELTVEKGEGYDLNRSLFERLVLKGYPHDTLIAQHRMRPQISRIVRHLTYPDLEDAPMTRGRPDLRGVRDNIVFINHDKPEDQPQEGSELRDAGSKSSKQNRYEARMVLMIVRYLAQQGYKTDNIVVLTPYLGQLSMLRRELQNETDPVLNDLDTHDLIAAGFITPAAAKMTKKRLRLATIDNYQGEESDIVVASLTRSNPNNDIGFMFAPERLNVLLSRARDALILIGNSDTFTRSRKGGALWRTFFELIRPHVYNGLPVRCEQHPFRHELVTSEAEFAQKCPDGGCDQACGAMLGCNLHKCRRLCHQIADHSKVHCTELITLRCPQGHNNRKQCSSPPIAGCVECNRQDKLAEAKRQKEFARKQKREKEEADQLRQMKELGEKLEEEKQNAKENRLREERENEICMMEADLADIRKRNKPQATPANDPSSSPSSGHIGSTGGRSTPQLPPGRAAGGARSGAAPPPAAPHVISRRTRLLDRLGRSRDLIENVFKLCHSPSEMHDIARAVAQALGLIYNVRDVISVGFLELTVARLRRPSPNSRSGMPNCLTSLKT